MVTLKKGEWVQIASGQWDTGITTYWYLDGYLVSQTGSTLRSEVRYRLRHTASGYSSSDNIYTITANGTTYTVTKSGTVSYSSATTVMEKTVTHQHGSDGKYTGTVSAHAEAYWNSMTVSFNGSVTMPAIATYSTPTVADFAAGETMVIKTNRMKSSYTHTITIHGLGATDLQFTNVEETLEISTYGDQGAIKQYLLDNTNGTKYFNGTGECITYNESGNPISNTPVEFSWHAYANSYPVISSVSYDDNGSTTSITGSSTVIIQNESTLVVHVTASTYNNPNDGNTALKRASVDIGGVTKWTETWNNGVADISCGTVSLAEDFEAVVSVSDTRGYISTSSVSVNVEVYAAPEGSLSAARQQNFYSDVDISPQIQYSDFSANNLHVLLSYRQEGTNTWSNEIDISAYANSTYTLSGDDGLDNAYAWDLRIRYYDDITGVEGIKSAYASIGRGIPMFFMDTHLKSICVGGLPGSENSFEMATGTKFGGDWNEVLAYGSSEEGTKFASGASNADIGITADGITTAYRKVGDFCQLRGTVNFTAPASGGVLLFTLPSDYQPEGTFYWYGACSDYRIARLYVNTYGQVKCQWVFDMSTGSIISNTSVVWCDISKVFGINYNS